MAPLRVGEAFGKPLRERAHVTPRFPRGIKDSDLRHADAAIQLETAFYWFHLNLQRYDLAKGAPYFGFGKTLDDGNLLDGSKPLDGGFLLDGGRIETAPITSPPTGGNTYGTARYDTAQYDDAPEIRGFDQAPFAPSPLDARVALRGEFGDVLPSDVIEDLSQALPGDWMWKAPPVQSSPAAPTTAAEALTSLIPVLDALAAAIKNLEIPAPKHGGMGHNGPSGEATFSDEDRQAVLEKIEEAKQAARSNAVDAPSRVVSIWSAISPKLFTFGQWATGRANDFFTEASKEAGKSAGKWVFPAAVAYSLGQHASVTSLFHQASALVEALGHLPLH